MTAKGKFSLVSTPIGNLKDISFRAVEALKNADIILAEDTRVTKSLISHLGITIKDDCRIVSTHAEMEQKRLTLLKERLTAGHHVVMVSDAGTPSISDPGHELTKEAIALNAFVEVIPGACAAIAALTGSGLATARFAFLGFLPKKTSQKKKLVTNAAQAGMALVMYESPLRVQELLDELHQFLGPKPVVVARELTKMYETFHRGVLGSELVPPLVEKGECVVVVETLGFKEEVEFDEEAMAAFIDEHHDLKTKELAAQLSEKFSLSKSDAYELVVKRRK